MNSDPNTLKPSQLLVNPINGCRPRDITWHEDNWDNPDSRFLAWTLHDHKEGGSGDVYIAFNAHGFQVKGTWQPAGLL